MKTGTVIMQFFLVVSVIGIGFWMVMEWWLEREKTRESQTTQAQLLAIQGTLRRAR